ncbi:TetR-like C-terminal domain-containing protein [Streptomyces sp. NPDC052109]|uniref:TetR-like C-terminal domain-containing protein n=1 Tax=Streptomyces sp. NPDC052109 TaxID=3155527 RepID=UPI003440AA49
MGGSQQRGRPRKIETDQVILAAACELLLANGYRKLSMEAVVANLAIDAPAEALEPSDDGEIGDDLHAWLDAFAGVASYPRNAALALALIAAAAENPADAQSLYGLLTGPSHQALTTRLRAAAAGRIRPDADLDSVGDALIGSIVIQLLTGRTATTRQHAHDLLEIVLRGLRPDTQPN